MKCKKCGHVSRDIAAMNRHYRKAHPGAMKRKEPKLDARRHRYLNYEAKPVGRKMDLNSPASDAYVECLNILKDLSRKDRFLVMDYLNGSL